MITILDINNFWSPSGGGVRSYHLRKMDFYRHRQDVRLIFAMQDSRNWTEKISDSLIIEHVKSFKIPGQWEYRFIWKPWVIRRLYQKFQPDLVEVGSPYWLPVAARWARWGLAKKPRLLGFWHADFPVTYVRRFFDEHVPWIAPCMEWLVWWYARWAYACYARIMVSSCEIMARMMEHKLLNLHWVPLGVDIDLFHPNRRDDQLVRELKAGRPERLTIFFPHRLTEEKGALTLIEAYPELCERLGCEPAIVFAGRGNQQELVLQAVERYEHMRYIGFLDRPEEVARYTASCDIGLAMSAWETFGLAILEAMACGQALVGADRGAAKEHIETAQCGLTIAPGEPHLLAEALCTMVNSERLKEYGQSARRYAEDFTWPAGFTRQLNLYQELMQKEEDG